MSYRRIRSSKFNPSAAVSATALGLWLVTAFAGCTGNLQTTATGGAGGRVGDIVVRDAPDGANQRTVHVTLGTQTLQAAG